jgi:hypothetical protein
LIPASSNPSSGRATSSGVPAFLQVDLFPAQLRIWGAIDEMVVDER